MKILIIVFLFVLSDLISGWYHKYKYKFCHQKKCNNWMCKHAFSCYYTDFNMKEKLSDENFVFYLPEQEREFRKTKKTIYCKKFGEGHTIRSLKKLKQSKEKIK